MKSAPRALDGLLAIALLAVVLFCAAMGQAQEPTRWKIILYSADFCAPCNRAKADACDPQTALGKFAEACDVDVRNVTADASFAKQLREVNRGASTPTFVLVPPNGQRSKGLVVIGYDARETPRRMAAHKAAYVPDPNYKPEPSPEPKPAEAPPAPEPPAAQPNASLPPRIIDKVIADRTEAAKEIATKIGDHVRNEVKNELATGFPPLLEKIRDRVKADIETEVQARLPDVTKAAAVFVASVGAAAFLGGAIGARIFRG